MRTKATTVGSFCPKNTSRRKALFQLPWPLYVVNQIRNETMVPPVPKSLLPSRGRFTEDFFLASGSSGLR